MGWVSLDNKLASHHQFVLLPLVAAPGGNLASLFCSFIPYLKLLYVLTFYQILLLPPPPLGCPPPPEMVWTHHIQAASKHTPWQYTLTSGHSLAFLPSNLSLLCYRAPHSFSLHVLPLSNISPPSTILGSRSPVYVFGF